MSHMPFKYISFIRTQTKHFEPQSKHIHCIIILTKKIKELAPYSIHKYLQCILKKLTLHKHIANYNLIPVNKNNYTFKTKQSLSITKCLHLLHMDLFGPSPQSINPNMCMKISITKYVNGSKRVFGLTPIFCLISLPCVLKGIYVFVHSCYVKWS